MIIILECLERKHKHDGEFKDISFVVYEPINGEVKLGCGHHKDNIVCKNHLKAQWRNKSGYRKWSERRS